MAQSFDPYYKWLGIPPSEQPPNHYRLLGVTLLESDPDVIDTAANKQMAYLHQCATGPHAALSQKLLNEVSIARVTLLNPKKKAAYDAKLAAQQPQNDGYLVGEVIEEPDPLLAQLPSGIPSTARALRASRRRNSGMLGVGILFAVVVVGAIAFFLMGGGKKDPNPAPDDPASQIVVNVEPQPNPRTSTPANPKTPVANPNPGNSPPQNSPRETGNNTNPNPQQQVSTPERPGRVNRYGIQLTMIPAGTFLMGSPAAQAKDDDEMPQHEVRITKPFLISVHEITQRQYQRVMGKNPSRYQSASSPVEQVTWEEAVEFCKHLSDLEGGGVVYRLPTEAEWEYVARAGSPGPWSFGSNEQVFNQYGWSRSNSRGNPQDVGRLKPNAFGVYDMHGNVAEWCQDWYARNWYELTEVEDPTGPTEDQLDGSAPQRVARGGHYDDDPVRCRSAYRFSLKPETKSAQIGFRIVQEVTWDPENPGQNPMIAENPMSSNPMSSNPMSEPPEEADPLAELWTSLRPLLAARDYAAAEKLLREAAQKDDLDAKLQILLEEDLALVESLKQVPKLIQARLEELPVGTELRIGGVGGLRFVRFDAATESIVARVGTIGRQRDFPMSKLKIREWEELMGEEAEEPSTLVWAVLYTIDDNGEVDEGKTRLKALSSTNHQAARWLNYLTAPVSTSSPSGVQSPPPSTSTLRRGQAAGDEWDDNTVEMTFIWCPPGNFTMGSTPGQRWKTDEETPVQVTLSQGFWIGKYEVTQVEWEQIMETAPWKDQPQVQEDASTPATYLSWEDAVAFCKKLTTLERQSGKIPPGWEYTLPTEAQWEYAARAGTNFTYSFSHSAQQTRNYAWYNENAQDVKEAYAHPVGLKSPNQWGLHDAQGNVWEWCRDWKTARLPGGTDPEVTEKTQQRVVRGGAWNSIGQETRLSFRGERAPEDRGSAVGFRLALVQIK